MESEVAVTSPCTMVSPTSQTPPAPPNLTARQLETRKTTTTTPAFLSNLGKPTLRGIRKCPQCGVYNGTRGFSCKNKACGLVFRDGGTTMGGRGAKKGVMEVVRVVIDGGGAGNEGGEEEEGGGGSSSGSRVQVFSVCQRGRGVTATQRGFVELVPTDTAIATGDGTTLLTRVNLGRCFLSTCRQGQRPNQSQSQQALPNSPKQGSSSDSPCIHIKQAMECQSHATPLPLKSSILEGLQASAQAREELWGLATESAGPLVQRVSRDTLVVKCHTGPCHPLGLLHLTIGVGGTAGGSKGEGKGQEGQQQAVFNCACQANTRGGASGLRGAVEPCQVGEGEAQSGMRGSFSSPPGPNSDPTTPEHCLHFYACVCAFASDDKLASEFASFLNYNTNGVQQSADCTGLCASDTPQLAEPITSLKTKRLRLEEPLTAPSVVCPVGVGREGGPTPTLRRPGQRKPPVPTGLKTPGSSLPVDESLVSLGFQQWLASVTERIHQTMHYQFDGKPEPLVFHIPQAFFNALQHRFSLGSKKRRLPNATTAFVRNDALPLGSFSKYTWHITNLLQVKRIFDTPELPLELTQSFVKNSDGSYSPLCCPELPPDPPEGYSRTERPQAIRPKELRTILKVGTWDQKQAIPFVIEWIPDILPRSRVGELRICFEYGHQHGGQPECCDGTAGRTGEGPGAERGARNKSPETPQSKHTQTVEILRMIV